jgi:hypothetical protein
MVIYLVGAEISTMDNDTSFAKLEHILSWFLVAIGGFAELRAMSGANSALTAGWKYYQFTPSWLAPSRGLDY